jgi:hypothetical protein
MPNIEWIRKTDQQPPVKERLLLIVDAAGSPPDLLLMGMSEVVVGYWTGSAFRPMVWEPNSSLKLDVRYWAKISHVLPEEVELQPESRFREDVNE